MDERLKAGDRVRRVGLLPNGMNHDAIYTVKAVRNYGGSIKQGIALEGFDCLYVGDFFEVIQ